MSNTRMRLLILPILILTMSHGFSQTNDTIYHVQASKIAFSIDDSASIIWETGFHEMRNNREKQHELADSLREHYGLFESCIFDIQKHEQKIPKDSLEKIVTSSTDYIKKLRQEREQIFDDMIAEIINLGARRHQTQLLNFSEELGIQVIFLDVTDDKSNLIYKDLTSLFIEKYHIELKPIPR